jgi:hypothetical protein
MVEIRRNRALRKDRDSFRHDLLIGIPTGDVIENQPFYATLGREPGGLRCSEMSVIQRHGGVPLQKGRFDHQHIGSGNAFDHPFGRLDVAHHDQLLAAGRRSENLLGIHRPSAIEDDPLAVG